jgi:hypothetical protein
MSSLVFGCMLLLTTHALGQATASSASVIPCSVRIRNLAAQDYDPASEFLLRGIVTEARAGLLKVRLPVGVVRIHLGTPLAPPVALGHRVEILASRQQDEQGQWFTAREVRTGSGTFVLRDPRGVRLPVAGYR